MSPRNQTSFLRPLAVIVILILGAYWAGARWGARQPINVGAVPSETDARTVKNANFAERDAALSSDEALNVRIYRQSASAVANVLTKATEYDFWMDPVPVEGAGSGFVMDAKGYILTNYHVVQGAQTIEVVLGDQSRHSAKFIGADQRNDVALIKIDPAGKPLAVLPLGDSSALQVGQKVLAIGNPFGFQSTLTTGVVSALGRTVQTGQNTLIDEAIQTDAAINRGNSGGPLINTHGEVIGINSAIYTPSGTTAGIGFAIPINTAKMIAHDPDHRRSCALGVSGRGNDSHQRIFCRSAGTSSTGRIAGANDYARRAGGYRWDKGRRSRCASRHAALLYWWRCHHRDRWSKSFQSSGCKSRAQQEAAG